jgi:hypothetical protein
MSQIAAGDVAAMTAQNEPANIVAWDKHPGDRVPRPRGMDSPIRGCRRPSSTPILWAIRHIHAVTNLSCYPVPGRSTWARVDVNIAATA